MEEKELRVLLRASKTEQEAEEGGGGVGRVGRRAVCVIMTV